MDQRSVLTASVAWNNGVVILNAKPNTDHWRGVVSCRPAHTDEEQNLDRDDGQGQLLVDSNPVTAQSALVKIEQRNGIWCWTSYIHSYA